MNEPVQSDINTVVARKPLRSIRSHLKVTEKVLKVPETLLKSVENP